MTRLRLVEPAPSPRSLAAVLAGAIGRVGLGAVLAVIFGWTYGVLWTTLGPVLLLSILAGLLVPLAAWRSTVWLLGSEE